MTDRTWVGYAEGHGSSTLVTDAKAASSMLHRYGKMRSQALSPRASRSLLEQMRGDS
nr:Scr1 family TA system antitoxin-like transcriptional regulator [Streptomyces sp. XM4193]